MSYEWTEEKFAELADWTRRWTIHIDGEPVDIEVSEDGVSPPPPFDGVVEAHLDEVLNPEAEGGVGEKYTRGWKTEQYKSDFGTHIATCQSPRQGIWGVRKEHMGRVLTHLPSGWAVAVDDSPKELAFVLEESGAVTEQIVRPLWVEAAQDLRDPEEVREAMT